MLLLINKDNIFNEKYIENIEFIEYENYQEDTIYIEQETFRHYEMLAAHLKVDDIIIDIKDGYRSLERQENKFLEKIKKYGLDQAEKIEDMPGTSDYHTGKSLFIVIKNKDKWLTTEEELLKEEKIFSKIHKSLPYFGFIIRYPKNKENITYHKYEPWHITYVGEELAEKLQKQTIEEYLKK